MQLRGHNLRIHNVLGASKGDDIYLHTLKFQSAKIKKKPLLRGALFYVRQILHCAFTFNFSGDTQKCDGAVVIGAFFAGFYFKGVSCRGKCTIDIGFALTFLVAGSGEETKQQTNCTDA
jgi:hypothetical protein